MLRLNIEKLRLAQAKACLTTTELTDKSDIGKGTLGKILNKQRKATPKTIGKLARALNVEVEQIVDIE
ncbi:helix-turn-helix domain-containing protein [Clostridium sp. WILCCON 0269]|uniref:Helix-turn-helix domain-containing protein n=1 Tax=Candidatus Clostridium eludens TaxID=3381663 RepID=A0ABW8SNI0_9CLOT